MRSGAFENCINDPRYCDFLFQGFNLFQLMTIHSENQQRIPEKLLRKQF